MLRQDFNLARKERGAILVISLVFLVAITLFTISSMRTSRIGLHMAQNDESRIAAVQTAQALADAIVANPGSTPVIGMTGYTACTAGESSCNRNDLAVDNETLTGKIDSDYISARVERVGTVYRPPPRIVESSLDKFTSASFTITTTFDRAEDGLGTQQVTEGVLVLISKQ
jgi:Tfp pilus assembly protein PilX